MPTESTFLFAGLLFLAAALGYVFARFGDEDDDPGSDAGKAGFLKGFRYLLDEQPDRAAEAFRGLGDLSEEGIETQIALGALFRRRGQLERAIRLHQDLLDKPGLGAAQRDRATFALAEDYLGAGLFDRAEELLVRLRDSPEFRVEALRRLIRICEVTSEWIRAVELGAELATVEPDAVPPARLAHYYCELAESARRRQAPAEALQWLRRAEALEPGKPRMVLVRGDLAFDQARFQDAFGDYATVARTSPALIGDVLARLVRAATAGAGEAALRTLLDEIGSTPDGLRSLAQAVIRDSTIRDPAALECLAAYVQRNPVLAELADAEALRRATPQERQGALERLRRGLNKLASSSPQHQCSDCGYVSGDLVWQCPGCRSWDTVHFADRLLSRGSPV